MPSDESKSLTERAKLVEGLDDAIKSKLTDVARSYFFGPAPLVVLYDPIGGDIVTMKLKRGALRHSLIKEVNESQSVIKRSLMVSILMLSALNETQKLIRQGYIEV